jgi:hypothetical protein
LTCDQERGIRQPGETACAQVSLLFIFDLFNMDPYRLVNATSSWFPALRFFGAGDPDFPLSYAESDGQPCASLDSAVNHADSDVIQRCHFFGTCGTSATGRVIR